MILHQLKNIPLINRIGRGVIKLFYLFDKKLAFVISRHWRVSGCVHVNFKEQKFSLFAKGDDGIVDAFYYQKNHFEELDLRLFYFLAQHSKVILDIGANTGIYSIIGNISNPSSQIYSFEPHPSNVKRLKKNLALNQIKNVKIVDAAVGPETSTVSFTIPEDDRIIDVSSVDSSFSKSFYRNGAMKWKEISVEQITIDSFVNQQKPENVDLLKVDVENYEVQAFTGAVETIGKFKPFIICELFLNADKKIFFDNMVSALGYHIYKIEHSGLVNQKSGFEPGSSGLNYFLTPQFAGDFVAEKDFHLLVQT